MNKDPYQGVECPECHERLFSYYGHDYKLCGCPNETMVDGGQNYLRYGWKTTKPKVIDIDKKKDKEAMKCLKELKAGRSGRWPY